MNIYLSIHRINQTFVYLKDLQKNDISTKPYGKIIYA